MTCKECRYFDQKKKYCTKHGTRQNKNTETSCGEYFLTDENGQEIDGRIFYLNPKKSQFVRKIYKLPGMARPI